jgi:hypothetical protein
MSAPAHAPPGERDDYRPDDADRHWQLHSAINSSTSPGGRSNLKCNESWGRRIT